MVPNQWHYLMAYQTGESSCFASPRSQRVRLCRCQIYGQKNAAVIRGGFPQWITEAAAKSISLGEAYYNKLRSTIQDATRTMTNSIWSTIATIIGDALASPDETFLSYAPACVAGLLLGLGGAVGLLVGQALGRSQVERKRESYMSNLFKRYSWQR